MRELGVYQEELAKWAWPMRSAKAEKASLVYHSTLFKQTAAPNNLDVVQQRMLQEYPRVKPYLVFGADGNLSRAGFEASWPVMLSTVVRDASPGFPLMAMGCQSNGEALEKYGAWIKECVWERMLLLASDDCIGMKPLMLVHTGLVDPVRVFVKNEPHKVEKIRAGRLRIISSVSLIDQLVEKALFKAQNQAEIDNWEQCPSKPGLGLNDDGLQSLWEYVQSWGPGARYESDFVAWDWGVQYWEMLFEADVRASLAGMVGTIYHRVMRNRMWAEANTVFMTSDGQFYAQLQPGKRCSGSQNTGAGNSKMRVARGYMCGAIHIMAMGDDSVELSPPEIVDRYRAMGFNLKMLQESKDGFEFCSMKIGKVDGVVTGQPVNWAKTFYRLLWATGDYSARLEQFKYEMRHSPHLKPCLDALERVGWGLSKHAEEEEGDGESSCGLPSDPRAAEESCQDLQECAKASS